MERRRLIVTVVLLIVAFVAGTQVDQLLLRGEQAPTFGGGHLQARRGPPVTLNNPRGAVAHLVPAPIQLPVGKIPLPNECTIATTDAQVTISLPWVGESKSSTRTIVTVTAPVANIDYKWGLLVSGLPKGVVVEHTPWVDLSTVDRTTMLVFTIFASNPPGVPIDISAGAAGLKVNYDMTIQATEIRATAQNGLSCSTTITFTIFLF